MVAREVRNELRARADSVRTAVDSSPARPAGASAPARPRPGPLALVFGLAVLVTLAYAAPIVIGVASPIHLLIAGFALYEAWKLNKAAALQVTGPYQAAAGSAPA